MRDSTRRECNFIIKGLEETEPMFNDAAVSVENASSVVTEAEKANDLAVV